MTNREFMKGKLILSGTAKNSEELTKKINDYIYYNSQNTLSCFKVVRGIMYFNLVSSLGEIQKHKIVKFGKNKKFQYRYF